ncbi:hypothetical protein [Halorubrum sp. CSM-61]|uniref:hypothetical protein n=1 Tax=Halorubrum sp. CSM-61 TaxID=2485838 RepID=UPI000F4C06B7|nr:hypothetical protein [Halorubrum sp. CSM-61]
MSGCEFLTPTSNRRGLQLYFPISMATDTTLDIEAGSEVLTQITPSGGLLLTPSDAIEDQFPQRVPAPSSTEYDAAVDAADITTHSVPSRDELIDETQPQTNP